MDKKGKSFWDVLAWVVLFGIFVWLLLKGFDIINTPVLIEIAPYLGAVYLAGWQMHKLDTVAKDVKELKSFKEATISKINNIETNCKLNHK